MIKNSMQYNFKDNQMLSKYYILFLILIFFLSGNLHSQSLDIPSSKWGLSFGNSKNFTGVRINWSDEEVEQINGLNITLWQADYNDRATVNGISLGLVMPEAGYLNGIQVGVLGVTGNKELNGISLGLLGAGSGGKITGLALGGLGVGSGGGISGIALGGLGVGSGGDVTGIVFGGLGVGSGGNVIGLMIGGLGVGSGGNVSGLTLGGLGVGAGGDLRGIQVGGLGIGAGGEIFGISIGGIGVGSGTHIKGITFGGIGVGSPNITGLTFAGIGIGGENIKGAAVALGMIRLVDHGYFKGIAASAFNYMQGRQTGIAIGIVNYAEELNGVQLGLINIAKNNPDYLKILPFINLHFD